MEWISTAAQKPEDNKKVWVGSRKNKVTVMGYYLSSLNCFFNLNGE